MIKINRKKLAVIIHGALICGVIGFLISTDFLKDLRYFSDHDKGNAIVVDCEAINAINYSQIYIAALDIPAGAEITKEMYVSSNLPTNYLTAFYVQETDISTHSIARMNIKRGMILTIDLIH